jgi:hypothetical protein
MSFPTNINVPINPDLLRNPRENHNFNYVSLTNQSDPSASFYSNESKLEENLNNEDEKKSNHSSDQKLPEASIDTNQQQQQKQSQPERNAGGFFFVNSNGFSQKIKTAGKQQKPQPQQPQTIESQQNQLICTNLILEVYKNNKADAKADEKRTSDQGRTVPSSQMQTSQSASTLNESSMTGLLERDIHGNVLSIHTQLSIDEENIAITYDHVKYINIFSILCCWCFPFSGLVGIYYSRLTKKYYNMRDMQRAKKFLNRAEWLLMLTFFFGLTLIAIGFACLESTVFKSSTADPKFPRFFIH